MPAGKLYTFLSSLKDTAWHYGISIQDALELAPYEYKLIKLMINADVEKLQQGQ